MLSHLTDGWIGHNVARAKLAHICLERQHLRSEHSPLSYLSFTSMSRLYKDVDVDVDVKKRKMGDTVARHHDAVLQMHTSTRTSRL